VYSSLQKNPCVPGMNPVDLFPTAVSSYARFQITVLALKEHYCFLELSTG